MSCHPHRQVPGKGHCFGQGGEGEAATCSILCKCTQWSGILTGFIIPYCVIYTGLVSDWIWTSSQPFCHLRTNAVISQHTDFLSCLKPRSRYDYTGCIVYFWVYCRVLCICTGFVVYLWVYCRVLCICTRCVVYLLAYCGVFCICAGCCVFVRCTVVHCASGMGQKHF